MFRILISAPSMHTHMCTHTHAHTHTHAQLHLQPHTHTEPHTHRTTHTQNHIHRHTHTQRGKEAAEALTQITRESGGTRAGVVMGVGKGQEGTLQASVSHHKDHHHYNQRHQHQAHRNQDGHQVGLGQSDHSTVIWLPQVVCGQGGQRTGHHQTQPAVSGRCGTRLILPEFPFWHTHMHPTRPCFDNFYPFQENVQLWGGGRGWGGGWGLPNALSELNPKTVKPDYMHETSMRQ